MLSVTYWYTCMIAAVALCSFREAEACPAEPHLVVPHIALRPIRQVLLGVQLGGAIAHLQVAPIRDIVSNVLPTLVLFSPHLPLQIFQSE